MPFRGDHYKYTRITTATTTQIKNGPGILKAIVFGVPAVSSTVGLIDGTSGTTPNIQQLSFVDSATGGWVIPIEFNIQFTAGLRIVTSQAQEVLVIWA